MGTNNDDNGNGQGPIDGLAVHEMKGQAWVRVLDLGEALEYGRPRDFYQLTKRLQREGILSDSDICGIVSQNPGVRGRGRPTVDLYVNESAALDLCLASRTPKALALRHVIKRVFMAWRRGELGGHADPRLMEVLRAQHEELTRMRAELAALQSGTIVGRDLNQLRAHVRCVVDLECSDRRWHSRRAAYADVYRAMGELTGWGGKGQPWKLLPSTLTHAASMVLRQREASIRRELRVRGLDRQLVLPLEPAPPPEPAPKKVVH